MSSGKLQLHSQQKKTIAAISAKRHNVYYAMLCSLNTYSYKHKDAATFYVTSRSQMTRSGQISELFYLQKRTLLHYR